MQAPVLYTGKTRKTEGYVKAMLGKLAALQTVASHCFT